ncbi:hypothetical protein GCK32_012910, partial [Trichostrongylus colubriformis]
MGSAQSQEEQPDVVRIDRNEIPEEYKTVGVSSDVVKRVNAQTGGGSTEAEQLRAQLVREQEEKQRLRQEMARLSELQKRQQGYQAADDIEERKRIFEETVARVQEKFFAYHRENVCADNEKEIMECLKRNPNRVLKCAPLTTQYEKFFTSEYSVERMKWLYGCVVLLALGLLYFRPLLRHRKSDVVTVWTLSKSSASFDSYRYRNCSVSTCLRSQRCMLDYGKISVYIQPITRVVDDVGNVLSPVPSKEFHTIRKLLLHYSVSDPQQACIFFPGIDFLNLHRFPSIDVAHAVANMIDERFRNVLMFTLIGEWKHNHRHIMASPIIPLHLYRHRLDISLSPYFGNLPAPTTSASSTHNTLLVMLFNASSSFREVAAEAFGRSA